MVQAIGSTQEPYLFGEQGDGWNQEDQTASKPTQQSPESFQSRASEAGNSQPFHYIYKTYRENLLGIKKWQETLNEKALTCIEKFSAFTDPTPEQRININIFCLKFYEKIPIFFY
ncbi:MAG: hypothetical protein HC848_06630 [Limnobacter sp.]|nr:hypothetical protein [Limnobacter sp.]